MKKSKAPLKNFYQAIIDDENHGFMTLSALKELLIDYIDGHAEIDELEIQVTTKLMTQKQYDALPPSTAEFGSRAQPLLGQMLTANTRNLNRGIRNVF